MLKTFKFTTSPERKFFLSSDLHLGHSQKFIVEKRGFKSIAEHDDAVINSINENVRECDLLLFLGDFCLNTTEEQFDAYIARIKCRNIWTLFGNHPNPMAKVYRDEVKRQMNDPFFEGEVYPLKYKNLVFIGDYLEIFIDKQEYVLCHYPIYSFNHSKYGAAMICGHSHGGCALTKPENAMGRYLDVGWDLFHKPLSSDEVRDLVLKKTILSFDHH
jgi:calcineurin-like phosphoesterase family protein